jgi:hypothetical protein
MGTETFVEMLGRAPTSLINEPPVEKGRRH